MDLLESVGNIVVDVLFLIENYEIAFNGTQRCSDCTEENT